MRVITAVLGLDLVILTVCLLAVFPSLFTLSPSLPSSFFPDAVLYERIDIFIDYTSYKVIIRDGDGTPLQYSCLENPMDGGAW